MIAIKGVIDDDEYNKVNNTGNRSVASNFKADDLSEEDERTKFKNSNYNKNSETGKPLAKTI